MDYAPLLPLNEASTVGLPPLTGTLKTVPSPYGTALRGRAVQGVAAERQAAITGTAPLLPLNEASTVGLPPLTGMLKTVPSPYAPPATRSYRTGCCR